MWPPLADASMEQKSDLKSIPGERLLTFGVS